MAIRRQLLAKQIIEVAVELSACHKSRVLTLQRATGGVARVSKERLLGCLTLSVKTLKHLPRHQDLATDLKLMGIARAGKHQRNAAYGLHVCRNIIALHTIATGDATHQLAVNIGKRNGKSVILHLAAHLKILATQSALHALIPVAHVLLVISVSQREHGILVHHLLKLAVQVASHTLRRRVWIRHLRMSSLKVLKFAHESIKVEIGNIRTVEHIILIIVFMQFFPKLQYSFFLVHIFFYFKQNVKPFTIRTY